MFRESRIVKAIKDPAYARQRVNGELMNLKKYLENGFKSLSPGPSPSEIINQKEIRIVGLRRTGNHAITNWIKKQEHGKIGYINNAPCDRNPYQHFYERHLSYNKYPKKIRKLKLQSQGKFTKYDCLLYSHEDYSLEQVTNQELAKKHDIYLGKSGEKYDVLIIRDPFNLLASRLKSNMMDVNAPNQTVIDLWLAYAQEYLGETQYLKNHKVCINYNRWTMDLDYRRQIAGELKLEFSDVGFNEVKAQGGGSSFEGQKFDGQASKMDVHNRWKYFSDDRSYRKLLERRELLEYSERIFGHISGTEIFSDVAGGD